MRILSLGAGVQSTTIAVMAVHKLVPKFDAVIFADTGSEPRGVYATLEWLLPLLDTHHMPVHRVQYGNLGDDLRHSLKTGAHARFPPLHLKQSSGKKGFLHRQCTKDYKVLPIQRQIRALCGLKPRQPVPASVSVTLALGISLDEVARMRSNKLPWITNVFPLIDKRMTRHDCVNWLHVHGYPSVSKSACVFCPFRSDSRWLELQQEDEAGWQEAVALDSALRDGQVPHLRGEPYLHASLQPLNRVPLRNTAQLNMFDDECAGVCDV